MFPHTDEKKMENERLKMAGRVVFTHFDKEGKVIKRWRCDNLVVNRGKEIVAKLLNGVVTNFFDYIQIGVGTTEKIEGEIVKVTHMPREDDTALEGYYMEGAAKRSYDEYYKGARWSYTFGFIEPVTITEAGLFDGPHDTAPNMLSRVVFPAEVIEASECLLVVWIISFR